MIWMHTSAVHSNHYTGRFQVASRALSQPRTHWRDVVKKDLQWMRLTWEETEAAAVNRQEWHRSVAQCVHVDVGWIKVNVKVIIELLDHYSWRCYVRSVFVWTCLACVCEDDCSEHVCDGVHCYNGGSCVRTGPDSSVCLCPLGTAGPRCQSSK